MPDYVLGHGRLRDLNAELEQLAMDARRTPERICQTYVAD
jgi:hypothetical protein